MLFLRFEPVSVSTGAFHPVLSIFTYAIRCIVRYAPITPEAPDTARGIDAKPTFRNVIVVAAAKARISEPFTCSVLPPPPGLVKRIRLWSRMAYTFLTRTVPSCPTSLRRRSRIIGERMD